jgi:toxin CcdB
MRQFDVCRLRHGEMVVVLQHDYLSDLKGRLVAPMLAAAQMKPVERIHVAVELDGAQYFVVMDQLTAVPASSMGRKMGSLIAFEYRLKNAIDRMFTGF